MNISNVVQFALALSVLMVLSYAVGVSQTRADIAALCDKQKSFIHGDRMFSCSPVSIREGGAK